MKQPPPDLIEEDFLISKKSPKHKGKAQTLPYSGSGTAFEQRRSLLTSEQSPNKGGYWPSSPAPEKKPAGNDNKSGENPEHFAEASRKAVQLMTSEVLDTWKIKKDELNDDHFNQLLKIW